MISLPKVDSSIDAVRHRLHTEAGMQCGSASGRTWASERRLRVDVAALRNALVT